MPLYIEILDHDSSVAEAAIRRIDAAGVLESWTSTSTGEVVRLVDAPEPIPVSTAPRRFARILFS